MNSDKTVDETPAALEPQKDWWTWSSKEWPLLIAIPLTPASFLSKPARVQRSTSDVTRHGPLFALYIRAYT